MNKATIQTISIWGSTGTIGSKACKIAKQSGFKIISLVGNKNYQKLIEQAKLYEPQYIGVYDPKAFEIVKESLNSSQTEVLPGSEFENLAKIETDCCIMAISGSSAIKPTFDCLGHAKRLAIASKEAIICGGKLLINSAKQLGTEIIPVDSEHSSIFQCLIGESKKDISEIILTASGGPFIDFEEKDLEKVTIEDALKHPNWNMGKKITIDSATLINKALELIEAAYLFDADVDKVRPLIHPESIIHGLVKFNDNSLKAALAFPDMTFPISYAINYPNRKTCEIPELIFENIGNLSFRKPKSWQERNMKLAYQAFKENKVIAFNTANEIAVSKFLNGELKFKDIYGFVSEVLENTNSEKAESIDGIFQIIDFVKQTYNCN